VQAVLHHVSTGSKRDPKRVCPLATKPEPKDNIGGRRFGVIIDLDR